LLRTKKGKERNRRYVGNKNRLRQVANANRSRFEVDHKDVKGRMRMQTIFLKCLLMWKEKKTIWVKTQNDERNATSLKKMA
jgi:hypothetical protein